MFKKMISIVAVAGLVLTLAPAANAMISVANSGSWGATGYEGVYVADVSVTHTIENFEITTQDNGLLVVMIGNYGARNDGAATNYLASVTFGGDAMTLQTANEQANNYDTNAYIYTMAAPDVGTTDDIVVEWACSKSPLVDEKNQFLTALYVHGNQPLIIADTESGYFADSGLWPGFDAANVPYYYAGTHNSRPGDSQAMDWTGLASADYDLTWETGNLLTSRARGKYFDSGNSSALSVAGPDTQDSWARIAIVEEIPEPATMSLLAIGGLGVLLMRRRRRA